MTISAVSIVPLEQPLTDPNWRFVSGPVSAVPGFVVHITNDKGVTGYGYVDRKSTRLNSSHRT